MITLTFEPSNPEQAALLGEFLPAYMKAGVLQISGEPEAVKAVLDEVPEVPKRAAKRKPADTQAANEAAPPAPAQAEPVAESRSEPAPAAPTLEQVRAKLAALSSSGKREQVAGLIGQFGAAKLTEIPVDRYQELLTAADAL